MSRNAISANSEHYIFKIFGGSMPPDLPRRPGSFFSLPRGSEIFSGPTSPKQRVLDRALPTIRLRIDDLT